MKYYFVKDGELYHHGVKGQKWGVRRFQNEDGTLTPAGKKRYAEDAEKLINTSSKHLDTFDQYIKTAKRYYYVDEHGNNRYNENGKRYFDENDYIQTIDEKKEAKALQTRDANRKMKSLLEKKYDEVTNTMTHDYKTGKAVITVTLKKNGNTYVSELYKEYGSWEIPTEFVTYAENKK